MVNELTNENNQALLDLVCVMPYDGPLMMVARTSVSNAFSDGCGFTAFLKILREIQSLYNFLTII